MSGGAANLVEVSQDVCALPLARRLAALLDRDPESLRTGDLLPRGWHVMMFNTPTRQSLLRDDGAAYLGVTLPDVGLPRLMLGGRQIRFRSDIPLGAAVRRESRQGEVRMKQGRSGRFALVQVEHSIFVDGQDQAALVETNDYVLREAGDPAAAAAPAAARNDAPQAQDGSAGAMRVIVPDERLLFRYSAITDNPHRIHYDQPYALQAEGYPALVVNGSIPAVFLLEMFRAETGREPESFQARNVAPMFCGRPLHLHALARDGQWRLWARDAAGTTTFEAHAT